MPSYTSLLVAAATLLQISTAAATPVSKPATCRGRYNHISAAKWIKKADPGWNLGNSLDAIPNEDSWNNKPVVESTFDVVKKSGFKSVRIPVSWAFHFNDTTEGTGPDWTLDPKFLARVEEVVDMSLDRGFYTLLNVHHDSWNWFDPTKPGANFTQIEEKFYRVWYQIADRFKCKGSLLAFEPINEPPISEGDDEPEQVAWLNKINRIFLQAINDVGGWNGKRVVTLVGPYMDIKRTNAGLDLSVAEGFPNEISIQAHYYSPYDFVFGAWGKTIWGSEEDIAAMEADISSFRTTFPDHPLVLGEWGFSPVHLEPAARRKYVYHFTRLSRKYNISTILWDNGNDLLDRTIGKWRDEVGRQIYIETQKSDRVSLADSTTDGNALEQDSSAYVFHRLGEETPENYTLPFILNGNKFSKVKAGKKTLKSGRDYVISGSSIVLQKAFLSQHLTSTTPAGILDTVLTVSFNRGPDLPVELVVWSPPTTSSPVVHLSDVNTANEVVVPISFSGIARPATVAIYRADGSIAFDDWTVWLYPLQRGRTTFHSQWSWDWGVEGVKITPAVWENVRASGQETHYMVEFYPRVQGNSVNITLVP